MIYIPAIIITGGIDAGSQSAELYIPASNTSCRLPDLPDMRQEHSQAAGVLCGGWGDSITRMIAMCAVLQLSTAGTM